MTLALDTASAWSTVAVVDGEEVLAEAEHDDPRGHAEVLASLVSRVLTGAGHPPIDVVACGVGPGPYTGLRIGVMTAQVLAMTWQAQIVGICSHDVIASGAVSEGHRLGEAAGGGPFVVASDARRGEVYWAVYSAAGERTSGPFVGRQSEVDVVTRSLPWVGLEHGHQHGHQHGQQVRAGVLGVMANRLLLAGEVPGAPVRTLSTHGTDDGRMAGELTGQRLLAPYPLYVRRPDASPAVA